MRSSRIVLRTAAVVFLGIVFGSSLGCSYLSHRYHDALDMFDIGLTFSAKPGFAAYKACAGLASVGYGNVKGRFIGLRGGRIGSAPFSNRSLGLGLWGRQKTWFKKAGDDTSASADFETVGVIGAVEGGTENIACVQQLHLGWAGVVFDINWLQIGDFLLGWTTADICSDDGKPRGGPPETRNTTTPQASQAAKAQPVPAS